MISFDAQNLFNSRWHPFISNGLRHADLASSILGVELWSRLVR